MKIKLTIKWLICTSVMLIISVSNLMIIQAKDSKLPYTPEVRLVPNHQLPTPEIFIDMGSPVLPIDSDFMGNEGAHGGSDIAFQFTNAAQNAIDYISTTVDPMFNDLKCILLTSFFNKVKIYVTQDPLYINNGNIRQKSVAISIPAEKTIYINEKAWQNISDENTKIALAMHELLILIGFEKTGDYTYSEFYLRDKKNKCKDSKCFLETNYSCELIAYSGPNNIFKKRKDSRNLNSNNLGVEYISLSDQESKTKVDAFLFESITNKDLTLTIYQNGIYLTKLSLSIDHTEKLPGLISHSWFDINDDTISWEVNCNRY